MNIIEVKDLRKTFYEKEVLRDLSMTIRKGDIYGFLGPNGSGKTTTLRILLGLLPADGGEITILGKDVRSDIGNLRQQVNVLPESHGFYGWMRAVDYISYFGALYGRHLDRSMCQYLIELVGLAADDKRPIGSFSRGMKQRLGIARTLVNNPKILFLDEPTNGLDPKGRRDIHALLSRLNREKEMTIILSTHILDDVEHLCNRIGILYHGKLQYQGALQAGENERDDLYRFRFAREVAVDLGDVLPEAKILSREGSWIRCRLENIRPDEAVASLAKQGLAPSEVVREGGGLEGTYLKYTGETA